MEPSGPVADFFAALRRLRTRVGEPSLRGIARAAGVLSHDTVHRTLTGPALPKWANVEAIVRALGADPETVKPLWLAARAASEGPPSTADEYLIEPSAKPVSLTAPENDLPEPAEIRVVVVDDHPLFRFGLCAVLAEAGFQVVGEAENGARALLVVGDQQPDVVVMDLFMPEMSGMEATARLVERSPSLRILVLTAFNDTDAIQKAMRAGAVGYLLKGTPPEDIVHAIRQVAAGIPVFTAEAATLMLERYRKPAGDTPPPLSQREIEVLRLVGAGLANREIAQALMVSVRTVDAYLTRIRDKLGLRNRASLVRYAIENDLTGK
jgi:DNA-binding NarL/FixJ family response regulator/DNA-binding phage protein